MTRRRTLLLLALVASVVIAGCAGSQGADQASTLAEGGDVEAATAAPEATSVADGAQSEDRKTASNAESSVDARAKPALVKTGTVVIEVGDYDRARRSLVEAVRSRGGYVSDSGVTRHREENRTWKTGYVVLRVPSGKFADLLAASRAEGTVRSEETRTRDVSEELVDLEARLENLRAKRDRLREFYDRANTTEELLAIEQELSDVQGKIERLEAKKRALEDKVSYSTLRVEIREPSPTPTPTPTPTPEPEYHEQSLSGAFAASIAQLVVFGKSALVTAAYALPYVLVVGGPLTFVGAIVWGHLRR